MKDAVEALLASAGRLAECKAARADWVRATMAGWDQAQREMDDRCGEAVARIDEDAFGRLCDAEQAKVDAFRKPIKDAAERDRWPRELYWGGI